MKKLIYCLSGCMLCATSLTTFADHCTGHGYLNVCYFSSLRYSTNQTHYFHCTPKGFQVLVKLTTHHVMMSGAVPGDEVGSGSLTISGIDASHMLDTYYFAVQADPKRHGEKHILIVSTGPLRCKMGKGGRPIQFPGLFG